MILLYLCNEQRCLDIHWKYPTRKANKKLHVRLINEINPWQPSILMQVDFIACFTMKITETWNGLKFLYSNHSHFLLLTCPHSFVLLKKWIKCVKYILRHYFFFVSFPFPTLSLKLCLVSISAFHLQSTHKRMWAGLQKKVRLVAVQNYEPNTWFGDFCTIK